MQILPSFPFISALDIFIETPEIYIYINNKTWNLKLKLVSDSICIKNNNNNKRLHAIL